MSQELIIADKSPLPVFAIAPLALSMRDDALASSALIGKVENAEQNNKCSSARKQIKAMISGFESQRKRLKEPILEAGRQLDRIVSKEVEDLKMEDGRLENLEKGFILAELRRKQEEEELQRKELARIEAEKQAELMRIASERAEAERKAKEAADAAAKLASEATNKKQREAAEVARIQAEKDSAAAAEKARQQAQIATERADAAAYIESKPVEISKAFNQTVRSTWIIETINIFQLMKARPDLVRKVEWDTVGLKQALADNDGKLPGVIARKDIKVGARGGNAGFIEV